MKNADQGQECAKRGGQISGTYYFHVRPEVLELVPLTARAVLDVGCGAGGLSANLKARQVLEVHGVELIEEAAINARTHMDKVWNCAIEEALPDLLDGHYDCIVIADVLEHLLDPWKTLAELKNKLTANGKLIASIPNIQNWDVLSEIIQGNWNYCNEGILDRTHLRFFTRKSVQELFWNAGLRITNLSTTVHGLIPPTPIIKGLKRSGMSVKELSLDGQSFQFLIKAEIANQSSTPKVVVVILNWNGKEDTLKCLDSVKQIIYPNNETLVVDNGSTDDSVDAITKQHPDIIILQTGANLGYAGGNNVGIRWALDHDADYILVLNNDTIVSPDLLSSFVAAKDLLPANSVLGAKIYFHDKPDTLWFAGGRWNSSSTSFEHLGYGQTDSNDFNHFAEIDYVTGCALFASAATFNEVGLLDESFFLTYEETDWCYRAREAGHKCIFVPDARLWHKVSSSFGGADSPLVAYFMRRNKLLWVKKHLSRQVMNHLHKENLLIVRKIFFPPFSLPKTALPFAKKWFWSLSSWLKAVRKNIADPMNQATLMALRDYYLGRFGDCPATVRALRRPNKLT